MENCLERLKEPFKKELFNRLVDYPLSTQDFIDDLEANVSFMSLKFETLHSVLTMGPSTNLISDIFLMFED